MKLIRSNDAGLSYIRALVHGDSGIGKTTSLGTLPEEGTIIAVGERGLIPLRTRNYTVWPFESWNDIRDLYAQFATPDAIKDKETKAAVKACRVLAIDSLSEVSDLCMKHIITEDRPDLIAERTAGKRVTPKGVYADLMQLEDWNLYYTRIMSLLSSLCHLPCHVICTILSRWTKDSQGGDRQCLPGLAGQRAPPECPKLFDLVLHMQAATTEDGKPTRQWCTFHNGIVYAKDSSGRLDPYEPADWWAVCTKILDEGDNK